MRVEEIRDNKKDFIDLLLFGDEQESMIDKYLPQGDMFALYDDCLIGIAVVTKEKDGVYELKNLAIYPKYQQRGYGQTLVKYILSHYEAVARTMYVGTGNSPKILSFYEKCGFKKSHIIKDFFTDNYDHPIIEDGIQLKDMIYLKIDYSD